ncbi:DUF3221 domain-containing protein [Paenibacillus mesophilus]|uniref:DUF3221 domain-containing protein n=1 Tax=Paenibacillus mesophilus TaxID=2582849 RepID=UPI00110E436C|nr:DUF3221 domain-containing protein [Paenibacillus mesophilus]TMV49498.1 DUF3221 domain-containing protein [Paenibacillus mesophilus]
MKTLAAAIVLLGSLLMVQGCGDGGGNGKDQGVSIRGAVIAVGDYQEGEGRLILVEGTKKSDTQYDKASVRVPKGAKMYAMADGKKKKASVSDLKSGQRVEIVFTGPVQESYPVQAEAKEVVILDGGAGAPSK